tara:strand:+ start:32 stop:565 length:534 start_codon:yes stop_codon:yes gene_type:complete
MTVIPLLPIFHKLNRLFFDGSLVQESGPVVSVRWSDNRLKTTAGFYKRIKINGISRSEIVLSKPVLKDLSIVEIESTLCHEMIHAWIDRILNVKEIHGANFLMKMHQINSKQNNFQINIRHNFPVRRNQLKYEGKCSYCGEIYLYRKRLKNLACKKCCNLFFEGNWDQKCLIIFSNN